MYSSGHSSRSGTATGGSNYSNHASPVHSMQGSPHNLGTSQSLDTTQERWAQDDVTMVMNRVALTMVVGGVVHTDHGDGGGDGDEDD